MEIISNSTKLKETLKRLREKGATIGFVPTMGALHAGHLSLIEAAARQCEVVVCSIFVNPLQFNEKSDFEAYPRDLEQDKTLLSQTKCHILFTPSADDIYPDNAQKHYDFGNLMHILEGKWRPGHFNGMLMVVQRFLEIISPDKAYFGRKDFQQYLLVQKLSGSLGLKTEIVGAPIIREEGGLAFSSRNQLLSIDDREKALQISKILKTVKERVQQGINPSEATLSAKKDLSMVPGLEVEYLEVADASDLNAPKPGTSNKLIALAAVRVGKVRLIDNLEFDAAAEI